MMDIEAIRIAAEYVGTIDNASGQMCQMKDDRPLLLLFEFGCPTCSEVARKSADEWGDCLELIVNSTPDLLDALAATQARAERAEHERAQLRIRVWNRALNACGGVGNGEKAADYVAAAFDEPMAEPGTPLWRAALEAK
jgi:hypothetical protein